MLTCSPYLLWFIFFWAQNFANQFNFYSPLFSIHLHNLRQRQIKMKLVGKFLSQTKKKFERQHIHKEASFLIVCFHKTKYFKKNTTHYFEHISTQL